MSEAKPFIKWIGGKRAILNQILDIVPDNINDYYEPFLGSGAVFFALRNRAKRCFLSDINENLITCYQDVQSDVSRIINRLTFHQNHHSHEYYYHIRSQHSLADRIDRSARFIYLIKTCFNGLYRVNMCNHFNAAIGRYRNPVICDENTLNNASLALQGCDIMCHDFSNITPKSGDLVYFDPPYYKITPGSFVKYSECGFSTNDHIRLRDFAVYLKSINVNVIISNSSCEFIHNLYKDKFNIRTILAPRRISCKAASRQPVNELLITSY